MTHRYSSDKPANDQGPRQPTRPVEHERYVDALHAPVNPTAIPRVDKPAPPAGQATAVRTDRDVSEPVTLARPAIRATVSGGISTAYREQAVRCATAVGCTPPLPVGSAA